MESRRWERLGLSSLANALGSESVKVSDLNGQSDRAADTYLLFVAGMGFWV